MLGNRELVSKSMEVRSSAPAAKSARCRHCAGPLSKNMETSSWTVSPLIRESFSMIGTAVGGTASAFYGFNHVMPIARRFVISPMWLQYLVGAPPVIIFSSACAGLAGGTVPALAQLVSSAYHATIASSLSSSTISTPPSTDSEKMGKTRKPSDLGC
ncbi:hypothetical protein ZOSMA_107G00580 [Zostera marina]|uniref:Uncharacterized protein n=1 Tax=Zostera marina TaxID=29655 RepID=A0A0K9Q5Z4_ZOSMR|nr:hypothetical protein ZOSMA_107G00580 [Zostera marina]